jgi:hypothetical protein
MATCLRFALADAHIRRTGVAHVDLAEQVGPETRGVAGSCVRVGSSATRSTRHRVGGEARRGSAHSRRFAGFDTLIGQKQTYVVLIGQI